MDHLEEQLSSSLSELLQWECILNYNEAESAENEQVVDLCNYMHQDVIDWQSVGTIIHYPKNCAYRFPSRFKGFDAKDRLVLSIKEAGRKSGLILQVTTTLRNNSKSSEAKVTLECFRHRPYSDRKDKFKKAFIGIDTIAESIVRQTLRDNGTSSRGLKGKSMSRKSKSRRSFLTACRL
ncbi:MAG: hypothetical protein ACREOZ_02065 [Gloeomargaritales cyanobacterium]